MTKLQWRSERFVVLAAFVASWLSTCFLFQAMDELADDHLGVDLRTAGLLLFAGTALAIACSCICSLRRGRSLKEVRRALRRDFRASPALRSPSTLFWLTFAAILVVALATHVGGYHVPLVPERTDLVVSLITAAVLATAAAAGAHLIVRLVPEVVHFVATLLARIADGVGLVVSLDDEADAAHSFASWSAPLFSRPPPLQL